MEKREPSCTVSGNVSGYSHCGEEYGVSLKTRNKTTIWPKKPPLVIHPEKTKTEKDTCTPMFVAVLFPTARTWEQLDVHWQMNGYRSCDTCIQWNITQPQKGMDLSQFSEIDEHIICYIGWSSQKEKNKYNNTYTWNLEKRYRWTYLQGRDRDADTEHRLVGTEGEGAGGTDRGRSIGTHTSPHGNR